jgi:YD repeat-containing protein
MVAIVSSNGLGLFNASNNILGNLGLLGDGTLGQAGGQAYVNAATGNLVLQFQDEELSGVGANLMALRTYNSLGTMSDGLGADWSFDGEASVVFSGTLNAAGSTVTRTTGDGYSAVFTWNSASGLYTSDDGGGSQNTLKYDSTNHQWVFTDGSTQQVERYGDSTGSSITGKLLSRVDASGNEIDFGYDASNRLSTITDKGSAQQIQLVYGTVTQTLINSSGTTTTTSVARVVGINTFSLTVDSTGRATSALGAALSQVSYSYDSAGRLSSVNTDLTLDNSTSDGKVYTASYTYDGTSNRIASITQSDGSSVSFTYDGSGRVTTVSDASGTQSFSYTAATAATASAPAISASTTVTDGAGQKWTYLYNSLDQLTEIDAPAAVDSATAPKTLFQYDARGNVTQVTHVVDATAADNQSVFYEYDANDNQILQRDSLGNTIARTFGSGNQLLTETHYTTPDPNGLDTAGTGAPTNSLTTYYVYDSQLRLRFTISAQGRVNEYRYSSNAELTATVDYAAALYGVSSLSITSPATLSALTSWASAQDQTQTQQTQYTYDLRGNLANTTQYATVNSSGSGVLDAGATVTSYIYDAYGHLLHSIAMRGSQDTTATTLTSYVYDGLGRLISQTDANGTQTTSYVNNQITVSNTATGLTQISTFDSKGRLISVSDSGNATGAAGGGSSTRTTQYVYDAAGRLAATIDPLGNQSFDFYDGDGRLQYSVDATGAVCGYTYDGAGQMLSQTCYATVTTTSGWLTATTANGVTSYTLNKTALTIGATGSSADVITNANDRLIDYAYDAAGRLSSTTNGVGTVTTTSYDGDSRVTGTATSTEVTKYFYDSDGNQVGVLDPLGYLTEKKYDAAGRMIETIQYATATPASSSTTPASLADPLASLRPTSSPSDLQSFYYYDDEGRVVGSVDSEGFLTQTTYDEQNNLQKSIRYMTPVTPSAGTQNANTLTNLINGAGASETTTTQFDAFGRISSVTGVDGTQTIYQYDAAGRLVRQVSASGTSDQQARDTRYNAFDEATGTLGGVGDATLASGFTEAQLDAAITAYGTSYGYDADGQQSSVTDANGHTTLSYYDADGRQVDRIDALGEVSEQVYDSFGDLASTRLYNNLIPASTTSANVQTLSVLQQAGGGLMSGALRNQLKGMQDATHDEIASFAYDQRGLRVSSTDAAGYNTADTYDQFGQLVRQTQTITKASSSTPPVTTTTGYGYDLDGNLISTTRDLGGVNFITQRSYDAFGRVVRSVDAAGNATTTQYLNGGGTVVVTNPLGHKQTTAYDALGRVFTITDALNNTTTYRYTDATRTMTMVLPALADGSQFTVTTVRTRNGQTSTVTDGRGVTTSYTYNADGQVTAVTQTSTVTDASGKVVTNPDGSAKTQTVTLSTDTYDKSGRLISSTDALGTVTQLTYSAIDQVLTRTVDPAGLNLTTKYAFDNFGQVITVSEGAGTNFSRVTTYRYDLDGNQAQVIVDPNGLKLTTTYTHDGLGDVLTVTQGTSTAQTQQATQYVYDKLGRLTQKIDAPSALLGSGAASERDLTTQYLYNSAGEVSRTIDAGGNSTWYLYNADGQLTQTISALGEVSERDYDADGRLIQTRRYSATVNTSSFGAVASGFTLQQSTVDQRTYFTYDADGRQTYTLSAVDSNRWAVTQKLYDANGNVIESRAYDQYIPDSFVSGTDPTGSAGLTDSQVTTELTGGTGSVYPSAAAALANTERTYFAYDASNRLRFTVDALGDVSENIYDNGGNVTETVRYAGALTSIPSNPIESVISALVNRNNNANQVTHFSYDAAGRLRYTVRVLASDGSGNPTQQVVTEEDYDALGQLVQTIGYATPFKAFAGNAYDVTTVSNALTSSVQDRKSEFAYDAAGRQVFSVQVLTIPGTGGAASTIQNFVTQNTFDAMGHVTQTTAYATPMSLSNYTLATLTSAVGTSANQSTQDRTSQFIYDAVGRERFTIAADRTLSETLYDALGQVAESRQFNLTVPSSTVATEAALLTLRGSAHVGDGTTRGSINSYYADGRLLSTTDAMGKAKSLTYDPLGNLCTMTDQNGNTWTYQYDRLGQRTDELAPQVQVALTSGSAATTAVSLDTHTVYDAFGNVTSITQGYGLTDSNGASIARTTTYGYDLLNRQILVTLPGYYDPTSGQVLASNPSSGLGFQRSVQTIYDALGNVVQLKTRTAFNTYQSEYKTYDALGRESYDVDALNHVAGFQYDVFGDQTAVTAYSVTLSSRPGPSNTSYWVDADVTSAVKGDTQSRTVTSLYDTLGRKTQVTLPGMPNYYYAGGSGANVNAASIGPPSGAPAPTTHYDYDAFGDLIHQAVQIDIARTQDTYNYYDAMGRQTLTVDALGYQTARSYDDFGNLKQVTEYAQPGALAALNAPPPATPAASLGDRITLYNYDALNRQTSIQRENLTSVNSTGTIVSSGTTPVTVSQTGYDGDGHITSQTDALGNVTTTQYNALGEVSEIIAPARLVSQLSSTADPFLNEVNVTPIVNLTLNAFGQVVRQTQSALTVPTSTSGAAAAFGSTIASSQTYDFGGNLIATTDANGNTTQRMLDYAGRLIRQSLAVTVNKNGTTSTQTLATLYVYDPLGRQTDVLQLYTDASGSAQQTGQHTAYDTFGEVSSTAKEWGATTTAVASLNQALVASYSYDADGHMVVEVSGAGTMQFFYNLAGQQTRQQQEGYTFASDGSAATATRISETDYDLLGRAILQRLPAYSAVPAGSTAPVLITPIIQRTYDRWGNVLTQTQGGYVVNSDSSHTLVSGEARTTSYTYNADNKVITQTLPTVTAYRDDGSAYQATVSELTTYNLLDEETEEKWITQQDPTQPLRIHTQSYDRVGEMTSDSSTGTEVDYAYDQFGNQIATRNASGYVTELFRDGNGNIYERGVLRQSDGVSAYHSGSTALAGSSSSGTNLSLSETNFYEYDQANRQTLELDFLQVSPSVNLIQTFYDERGLVTSTQSSDTTVTNRYDQFGDKTQTADADGHTQNWAYNSSSYTVGQLSNSSAGTFSSSYTYDGFGELSSKIEANSADPSMSESCFYGYFENGLQEDVIEKTSVGVAGSSGGADYRAETASTHDDYTVNGQQADDTLTDTISKDVGIKFSSTTLVTTLTTTSVQKVVNTYDAQGRLTSVTMPVTPASGSTPGINSSINTTNILYNYDEMGNRREIDATYTLTGQTSPITNDTWYDYDSEGRMTIASASRPQNGEKVSAAQNSAATLIGYNAMGQEISSSKYQLTVIAGASSLPGEPGSPLGYDQYYDETFIYNDLGFLVETDQAAGWRNIVNSQGSVVQQDSVGAPVPLEQRTYDTRGDMVSDKQYFSITSGGVANESLATLGNTSTLIYSPGGLLRSKSITPSGQSTPSTILTNHYDAAGYLTSYSYEQNVGTSSDFTDTFAYGYVYEPSGNQVSSITETLPQSNETATTTNTYDPRGYLITQNIETDDSSKKMLSLQTLGFVYNNQGEIVQKNESISSGTTTNSGALNYIYAQGHEVAELGTNSLSMAQFVNGYVPLTTASGTTPGAYVVNSGDTLGAIAQLVYGDASLWYVIANANNLSFGPNDALPSGEVGRTYRIPSVTSSQSNANTFTPYNPFSIIGSGTPGLLTPGPPAATCAQQTEMVLIPIVAAAAAAAATVFSGGTLGPVMAGILGSVIGDLTQQGLNMWGGFQQGFNDSQLVQAFGEGVVTGAVGGIEASLVAPVQTVPGAAVQAPSALSSVFSAAGGFSNSYANIAQNFLINQAVGGSSKGFYDSLWGLGTQLAVNGAFNLGNRAYDNATGKVTQLSSWAGAYQQIASSALNPEYGWFSAQSPSWSDDIDSALTPIASQLGGMGAAALSSWMAQKSAAAGSGQQTSGPTMLDLLRRQYPDAKFDDASIADLQSEVPGTALSPDDSLGDLLRKVPSLTQPADAPVTQTSNTAGLGSKFPTYQSLADRLTNGDAPQYSADHPNGIVYYTVPNPWNPEVDTAPPDDVLARYEQDQQDTRDTQAALDRGDMLLLPDGRMLTKADDGKFYFPVEYDTQSSGPSAEAKYGAMENEARRAQVPPEVLISTYFRTPDEFDAAERIVRNNMHQQSYASVGTPTVVTIDYQAQLDEIARIRKANVEGEAILGGPFSFLAGAAGAGIAALDGHDPYQAFINTAQYGHFLDPFAAAFAEPYSTDGSAAAMGKLPGDIGPPSLNGAQSEITLIPGPELPTANRLAQGVQLDSVDSSVGQEASARIAANDISGVALARAADVETNAVSPSFQNFFRQSETIPGAAWVTQAKFTITDVDTYIDGLAARYETSDNPLNPMTEMMIRDHIELDGQEFKLPDGSLTTIYEKGLPGSHAEVQAANWIYNQSPPEQFLNTSQLGVVTYRLIGGPAQGGPFLACPNCSSILPPDAFVPTGRGH